MPAIPSLVHGGPQAIIRLEVSELISEIIFFPQVNCSLCFQIDRSKKNIEVERNRIRELKKLLTNPRLEESAVSYEDRLKTFETWPESLKEKAESLAAAGFYYTGVSDEVKCCFSCAGCFKSWRPDHCPTERHRVRHPECTFYGTPTVNNDTDGKGWHWESFVEFMVLHVSRHCDKDFHLNVAGKLRLRDSYQTWLDDNSNQNKTIKEKVRYLMRAWRADAGDTASPTRMHTVLDDLALSKELRDNLANTFFNQPNNKRRLCYDQVNYKLIKH